MKLSAAIIQARKTLQQLTIPDVLLPIVVLSGENPPHNHTGPILNFTVEGEEDTVINLAYIMARFKEKQNKSISSFRRNKLNNQHKGDNKMIVEDMTLEQLQAGLKNENRTDEIELQILRELRTREAANQDNTPQSNIAAGLKERGVKA